ALGHAVDDDLLDALADGPGQALAAQHGRAGEAPLGLVVDLRRARLVLRPPLRLPPRGRQVALVAGDGGHRLDLRLASAAEHPPREAWLRLAVARPGGEVGVVLLLLAPALASW